MFLKSTNKDHIHLISFDVPYPPDYGGSIDVFYKIKAFKEAGIKVHLHCFRYNGRKPADELKELCESVNYYKRNISKTNLFRRRPYIVVTRSSEELMQNLLKDNYPILFEGLHTCYHLNDKRLKKRKKIVRTHNIEHLYYMHLAKVETNIFRRYYFYNEANKLKRYQDILKHASGIAAISRNDRFHLAKHFRNVVEVSAFHSNSEINIKEGIGDYALYHGSLSVGENNEAAMFLIKNVFNDLDVPLVIAGNKPSRELKQAAVSHNNVILKSDITTDDIYNLVANAQINILPTFQSTGIKLKLLAALHRGRHCMVNTPMVKDTGLEQLCVIKNTPAEMKQEIKNLFTIPISNNDLLKREEILTENGFSNNRNIKKLIKMLMD